METIINYKGFELIVKGVYTQAEEQISYDSDMSGYPGSYSDYEVKEIYLSDSNINIVYLFEDDIDYITELCLKNIEE
jgi:hypothetical protein